MSPALRIGMVVPARGFAGGIERYAWELSRALREAGHRVVLLHGSGEGRDPDLYAAGFDDVARFGDDPLPPIDVAYVHRASDVHELAPLGDTPLAVATHDHDLTCVRSHRYLPVGRTPCHRAPGVACVSHGCALVRDRRPDVRLPIQVRSPFALRRRLRALSSRAPLVANSRYVADQLLAAGADPRAVRVIHPVPPEPGAPPMARPAQPRLLVVAQLVRGKGVDLAIEALAHLPAAVSLEVVGDGPSRDELERLASHVAPGRVRFAGWVGPDAVRARYDAARAVVVPSRWPEPFGMVGIEAMRRARPVVGAAHGGIPEWLLEGEVGRLFTPGSIAGLARAARETLEDDHIGQRAHASALERFSHAAHVDAVQSLLAELAGHEHGTHGARRPQRAPATPPKDIRDASP